MSDLRQNRMGTESMTRLVIGMSLPPIFSMFIQAMYNIVDSIFVAKIGMEALTAVSLAFPMQQILVALFVGTGAGTSSIIARRLGAGDIETANKAASHSIVISFIYSIAMVFIGVFFTDFFVSLFTDDPYLQDLTSQYLRIILIYSFSNFIYHAGMSILQSTGNTMTPMLAQLAGAIANIILDPIMIFGLFGFPAMGVEGAAYATVIGQLLSLVIIFYVFKKEKLIKVKLRGFKFEKSILKDIFSVSLPAIVMQSLASVMISGLNIILISFSEAAVSVLGIYFKLQSFVFMPVFGMMQAHRAIIGYNFGAKNKERVLDSLRTTLVFSLLIMILGTIIFQFFTEPMLRLFDSNEEMMNIGINALKIISWTFAPAAVGITISSTFQAFGRGVLSLIISFARQLIVLLPVAYILSKIGGLDLFWYAFTISEVAAFLIAVPAIIYYMKSVFNQWSNQSL